MSTNNAVITLTRILRVIDRAAGGHSVSAVDDHVRSRTRHRLQQAVHESRHQHHDQEAGEAEAGRFLVHGSAALSHLVLHRAVVRRRQPGVVHRRSVQSVRTPGRRRSVRADRQQRLHGPQQSLVRARCLHAAGV